MTRPPTEAASRVAQPYRFSYFNAVEMLVKVLFRLVPTVPTTVMIATEMPAAMRPYSMAVAPD